MLRGLLRWCVVQVCSCCGVSGGSGLGVLRGFEGVVKLLQVVYGVGS